MSIKELAATEGEAVNRYLVYRQGGLFGGGKHQILTVKSLSIELCDATEKEDNRETFKLSDIVKIVPIKSRESLTQAILRILVSEQENRKYSALLLHATKGVILSMII